MYRDGKLHFYSLCVFFSSNVYLRIAITRVRLTVSADRISRSVNRLCMRTLIRSNVDMVVRAITPHRSNVAVTCYSFSSSPIFRRYTHRMRDPVQRAITP